MKEKVNSRELRKQLLNKREQLGLNQYQVAEMLGLKQPTYNNYENAKATPKGERLRIIEDYLKS